MGGHSCISLTGVFARFLRLALGRYPRFEDCISSSLFTTRVVCAIPNIFTKTRRRNQFVEGPEGHPQAEPATPQAKATDSIASPRRQHSTKAPINPRSINSNRLRGLSGELLPTWPSVRSRGAGVFGPSSEGLHRRNLPRMGLHVVEWTGGDVLMEGPICASGEGDRRAAPAYPLSALPACLRASARTRRLSTLSLVFHSMQKASVEPFPAMLPFSFKPSFFDPRLLSLHVLFLPAPSTSFTCLIHITTPMAATAALVPPSLSTRLSLPSHGS
ncbi:hypothetical protein EI94DRAFT_259396 [Lactarius quietus]|nr:hypothetical protein EI94DRAFT_259396 [Lactarius quietus]